MDKSYNYKYYFWKSLCHIKQAYKRVNSHQMNHLFMLQALSKSSNMPKLPLIRQETSISKWN